MTALGLLPLLALPLGIAVARTLTRSNAAALLAGLIAWGVACTAAIEVLGAAGALSRGPLFGAWLFLDATAVLFLVSRRHEIAWRPRRVSLSVGERFIAGGVVALLALELAVCLLSPPTTWDSMTYHLPRVMHWLQDHNLSHYPTSIDRQLWMSPWTEYVIAQVHGLAGWDFFDNLVQWTAGVVLVALSWQLSAELGLSRRARWFSVAATVTVPMIVVQSTSTQTDLATGMWVVAFVVAAIRDVRCPSWRGANLCGLTLGLALLTKGSAFVFCAPFAAAWVFARLLRARRLASFAALATAAIAAVAVVAPFFAANYASWHDPLGPPGSVAATNSTRHTPGSAISTLVRDIATATSTPVTAVNDKFTRIASGIVRGVGENPSDPATTFGGNTFQVQFYRDEDYASAPLHAALLLGALIFAAVVAWRGKRGLLAYASVWVVALVLFATLIRWSFWNNRIEIALFATAMPLVGAFLDRWPRVTPYLVLSLLGVSAFGWLVVDDARPLAGASSILSTPRATAYFEKRQDLARPYSVATAVVAARHAKAVGLVMGGDDWEYPLLVLIRDKDPQARFFDARPADWRGHGRMPSPDILVCTDTSAPECQGGHGWTVLVDGSVRVLTRS